MMKPKLFDTRAKNRLTLYDDWIDCDRLGTRQCQAFYYFFINIVRACYETLMGLWQISWAYKNVDEIMMGFAFAEFLQNSFCSFVFRVLHTHTKMNRWRKTMTNEQARCGNKRQFQWWARDILCGAWVSEWNLRQHGVVLETAIILQMISRNGKCAIKPTCLHNFVWMWSEREMVGESVSWIHS